MKATRYYAEKITDAMVNKFSYSVINRNIVIDGNPICNEFRLLAFIESQFDNEYDLIESYGDEFKDLLIDYGRKPVITAVETFLNNIVKKGKNLNVLDKEI